MNISNGYVFFGLLWGKRDKRVLRKWFKMRLGGHKVAMRGISFESSKRSLCNLYPTGSMALVYLPTSLVDFYGKFR